MANLGGGGAGVYAKVLLRVYVDNGLSVFQATASVDVHECCLQHFLYLHLQCTSSLMLLLQQLFLLLEL